MFRSLPAALTVVAMGLVGACGSTDESVTQSEVVVFAAASLADAFDDIIDSFEQAHPGHRVTSSYGGSSTLATQIAEGAPVDVYASADRANVDRLIGDDLTDGDPTLFATNSMVILTTAGNPLGIDSVADLEQLASDATVVLCDPTVPCGGYAQQVFERAAATVTVDSYERSVSGVVTKVRSGEADVGIAYATDGAATAGDTVAIGIPADLSPTAEYFVTGVVGAPNPDGAAEFVDYLASDEARRVLADHGFGTP